MKSAQEQEQAAQWEASNPFGPLVWAEMLLLTYHGHQLSRPTVWSSISQLYLSFPI